MDAAAGSLGDYDLSVWESHDRGRGLGHRRTADGRGAGRPAAARRRPCAGSRSTAAPRSSSTAATRLTADAVVCAVPVGPLRDIALEGLSPARLASLRRQRHARAGKVVVAYDASFWQELGRNGLCESENLFGSTWPQGEGVLSILVPPERLLHHLSTADEVRRAEVLDGARADLRRARGRPARLPAARLGRRPVHPRLRDPVGAGRRDGRRPAARDARAPVLRGRLRPLGGRLHGGRGAHGPRCGEGDPGTAAESTPSRGQTPFGAIPSMRAYAADVPRPAPAVRPHVRRDRRRLRRPGEVGELARSRSAQGRAPPPGLPREPKRRHRARPARLRVARATCRPPPSSWSSRCRRRRSSRPSTTPSPPARGR